MELAFAAHGNKIIGQRAFQEIDVLAFLSFRDRVGVGDQRLLQRAKRLGRIPRGLREGQTEKLSRQTKPDASSPRKAVKQLRVILRDFSPEGSGAQLTTLQPPSSAPRQMLRKLSLTSP